MADNYLEKKMEEWQQKPSSVSRKPLNLARLIMKSRSYRGYDKSFVVRRDQLLKLVEAVRLVPSARNRQPLRYRLVLRDEAHKVLPHIRLGGALPELHLPFAGSEPEAFVVICRDASSDEDNHLYIDLGIAAQSLLLRATEMGLGGIMIGAFDAEPLKRELGLKLQPLLVVAIGRPAEQIEIKDITAAESRAYYRENGVHYVPKLRLEELLVE